MPSRQDGDDGDDDEQLNQCERLLHVFSSFLFDDVGKNIAKDFRSELVVCSGGGSYRRSSQLTSSIGAALYRGNLCARLFANPQLAEG